MQDAVDRFRTQIHPDIVADDVYGDGDCALIHAHEEALCSEELHAEHPDLAARHQNLRNLEHLQHVEDYVNTYCAGVRETWPIFQKAIALWELPPGHLGQMSIVNHPMFGVHFFHWLDAPLTGRLVRLDKDQRPVWPVSSQTQLVYFKEALCKVILPAVGTRCMQIAGPRRANDKNHRPVISQEMLDFHAKCSAILDDGTIAPLHPRCLLCNTSDGPSDVVSCIMCMTTFHTQCSPQQLPEAAGTEIADCHRQLLKAWCPPRHVIYKLLSDMGSSVDSLCHSCKVLSGVNRRDSWT